MSTDGRENSHGQDITIFLRDTSLCGNCTYAIKPPYTERYVRLWCAAKAGSEMEEGPPAGTGQADLPNNLLLL
ncbi:hypothetical protein [Syntrophobotulus glycolicus]|uniref:hypothetical protein n=1 Tax=Syntrophobotulus glycolicus TaxID=51197 RepID=UPI0011D11640|nr:hypothetical protein [Syntrophobotulus glycolicus]